MNLQATIGFHSNPVSKNPSEHGSRELDEHMNRDEIVCLDFDGVLSASKGPYTFGHFGPPIREGINLLKLLIANGFRPVILTARRETDLVANWLRDLGFHGIMVTNHKVAAVAYIDDRAFNFDMDSSTALDIFRKIQKKSGKKKSIL